jgi:hypothetical protein
MANKTLMDRVENHVKKNSEDNITKFYNRAILNQLEHEGDFEIRDIVEEEEEYAKG